jgi:hypothetical protein
VNDTDESNPLAKKSCVCPCLVVLFIEDGATTTGGDGGKWNEEDNDVLGFVLVVGGTGSGVFKM